MEFRLHRPAKAAPGPRKPLHTRWWFWLLLVLAVSGAVGTLDSGSGLNTAAQPPAALSETTAGRETSAIPETAPKTETAAARETTSAAVTETATLTAAETKAQTITETAAAKETTAAAKKETAAADPAVTQAPAAQSGKEMVWVSATGKKYHTNSSCSGMKSPYQLTLSEAAAEGYTACKRCH